MVRENTMQTQTTQVLRAALTNGGFFTSERDLEVLARDNDTRLTQVLVRCGGGRFRCPAQDAEHFISLVVSGRHAGQDEYVRDVGLTAGEADYWRVILGMRRAS